MQNDRAQAEPGPNPLQRLREYATPYKSRIRWNITWSILNRIFDLAPPVLIGVAINIVTEREDSWLAELGITDLVNQLWAVCGLTVFVWVLESIFEYWHKTGWRNLAQSLEHDLRLDTYGRVQDMELAFFEDKSSGGLMSILNDDVNQLERFLNSGANDILQVSTSVVVIGAIFFFISPEVALMAMLPMPFILWGSIAFQKHLAPRYSRVREEVGSLNGDLAGNLGGMATIKSFAAEDRELERIERGSRAYEAANQGAIRLSSAFSPLIRMVVMTGFVSAMGWGGWLTLNGELDPAAYTIIVFMTQRLLWPLTGLGEVFDLYQRAMASATRILDLLDVRPTISHGETVLTDANVRGDLRFEAVNFKYSSGSAVLTDLDLHIRAGKTTAFVGQTGSGKSTIVKLLLRFYDPTGGRITLDGLDLKDLNLVGLRKSIGLVSQDVFLFHGTVRENIAYGNPDATDEQIREAALIAEADEFIQALPEGYETGIGERGHKLSGGQRQRISIARAVLKDPPILILDEATSSVDNETEAAIQRSFERLSIGRTTIVIAHRLSTIRNADHVYVIDAGRVLEEGAHADLAEKDGLYASLWRVQTGEAVQHASQ